MPEEMLVRYERKEWASPTDPWLQRGRIDKIVSSPNGGSTGVAGSQEYKYKLELPDDSPHAKANKRRVKAQALTNAQDNFDDDKVEAKRVKRRERAAAKKAAEAPQPQPQPAPPERPAAASPQEPLPVASGRGMTRTAQVNWALLRAHKRIGNPAGVLELLRLSGLVPPAAEDEELWTPQRVDTRRRVLCDAVRMIAELIGDSDRPLVRMQELRALCE